MPRTFARRLITLARLTHAFPTAFVVLLSACLLAVVHGDPPPVRITLPVLVTVLLSQISVGTLNDYVDRDLDALMQASKPIPSGEVPPQWARRVAVTAGLLVPLAALPLGPVPVLVAAVGLMGGLGYDLWLKPTPFSAAGYLVGFLSLITFVWVAAGTLSGWFFLVFPAGTGLVLGAHLANSYPDVETDRRLGLRGLAVLLGPAKTRLIALASVAIVAVGGLLLSALERCVIPGATFLVSTAAIAFLWMRYRDADRFPGRRVQFFRGLAACCGACALGGVLLIRALSA